VEVVAAAGVQTYAASPPLKNLMYDGIGTDSLMMTLVRKFSVSCCRKFFHASAADHPDQATWVTEKKKKKKAEK